MPSLWSEVQLTYVLIMTVFLGIFRAIDIGLHSRDFHTAQSAHSAWVHQQFGQMPAPNWVICGGCQMLGTLVPFWAAQ